MVFYEGDLVANGINTDPAQTTPLGGYFTDLTVEVLRNGTFVPVTNANFSELLDKMAFYQRIEISFDSMYGEAIRIRGTAGGSSQFTSIVELEAYGSAAELLDKSVFLPADVDAAFAGRGNLAFDLNGDQLADNADVSFLLSEVIGARYGDTDLNGLVNLLDLAALASSYGRAGGWAKGDFNGDGLVNVLDLSTLAANYGKTASAAAAVPEPATILLLGAASFFLRRRR